MGIKGLIAFLNKKAPTAFTPVGINDLQWLRIGIDASLSIYQWCAIGESRKIVNRQGKYINHIQGCFFRTVYLITHDITPVYIFDGTPPVVKADTLAQRKLKATVRVPGAVYAECMRLLELMGVPCIRAPGEAEAQAASMVGTTIDGVATDDTDSMVFGAGVTYRGLDNTGKAIRVSYGEILTQLGVDADGFIDMCMLMGSDYTRGTMSPLRAHTAVKEHHPNTLEWVAKTTGIDYRPIRKYFTNPSVVRVEQPKCKPPAIDELKKFLLSHGLEPSRFNTALEALNKYYNH